MKYFVTNVGTSNYNSATLSIKRGTEVEVSEDRYVYLNSTFGASGRFTFRTEAPITKKATKKSTKKAVAPTIPESTDPVIVAEDV